MVWEQVAGRGFGFQAESPLRSTGAEWGTGFIPGSKRPSLALPLINRQEDWNKSACKKHVTGIGFRGIMGRSEPQMAFGAQVARGYRPCQHYYTMPAHSSPNGFNKGHRQRQP